jgi:diguanylate cyclase
MPEQAQCVAIDSADQKSEERVLRATLARTLNEALAPLLQGAPALSDQARALAESFDDARAMPADDDLRLFFARIAMHGDDIASRQQQLQQLLTLLLDNIGELIEEDAWLRGRLGAVRRMLAGPLDERSLGGAADSLKEAIHQQGRLKGSLAEARSAVKTMLMRFIDRLGAAAASTDDYHRKIERHAQQIGRAADIGELERILEALLSDTRSSQQETLRSRDEMVSLRQQVVDAEARIRELEQQLEQMGELVREDQLTGALNRRGLDEAWSRESARAARRGTPLCVALIDLDDFKRLNDSHGHAAGDAALAHLVRVARRTLRTMDVVCRFGGEEFAVLLPDTPPGHALQAIERLRQELARRVLVHAEHVLELRFSAGVTQCRDGENLAAAMERADAALYQAKHEGKNRVVLAD